MGNTATRIPYRETNFYSSLVLDFLDQHPGLRNFYSHPGSLEGIRSCLAQRRQSQTDRQLLVDRMTAQYADISLPERAQKNLDRLRQDNCFTITTAHQNNIFSGPLYFAYKILHAIALAAELKNKIPECEFVPVFYMGSEDADLDELDHIYIGSDRYQWKTDQTGAVGRMKVDQGLLELIDRIEGQLGVYAHGSEWIKLLRDSYTSGRSIAEATFRLVHTLFAERGLLVLMPDDSFLKRSFSSLIKKELLEQFVAPLVQEQASALSDLGYKVQATPRDINLFYLQPNSRQRIEKRGAQWLVKGTSLVFTEEQLLAELAQHPERFSPNVLLRGLYQCSILPDVAFIGGGAEISYWLQQRKLFDAAKIPMPVLVLRNSFMLTDPAITSKLSLWGLGSAQLFESVDSILQQWAGEEGKLTRDLSSEKESLQQLYSDIKQRAGQLDPTLIAHVASLEKKSLKGLEGLEKKLWRSIKRKHVVQLNQLVQIKEQLFPQGVLQERHQHLGYFYARYGKALLDQLFVHSGGLAQDFTILELP